MRSTQIFNALFFAPREVRGNGVEATRVNAVSSQQADELVIAGTPLAFGPWFRLRCLGVKSVVVMTILLFGMCAATSARTSMNSLAAMLAKGWFGGYVEQGASIAECVAFLNQHGICFPRFDSEDAQRIVSEEDVARVVGQATLLFKGEDQIKNGCIIKPAEAKSWVDFCVLNDIEYLPIWNAVK